MEYTNPKWNQSMILDTSTYYQTSNPILLNNLSIPSMMDYHKMFPMRKR